MGTCLSILHLTSNPPARSISPSSFAVREAWFALPECCKFARRHEKLCCQHDRVGGGSGQGRRERVRRKGRGPPFRDERGRLVFA